MEGPVDFVYHLASPASPIDYLRLPLHTLKVGSYGTHHALGLAKKHRARFLLASTCEVYGDPQVHPQPESYWGHVNPIGPRGVYDEAKRYAEALDVAYHATVFGVFSLNGERCTAGSRVLVQREIYDDFVARFAQRAKNIKVGLPSDPTTEVGSLVHPNHFEKVMSYIEIGKTEAGSWLAVAAPKDSPQATTLHPRCSPTSPPDARIFQEEIFGPVVAITPFDTDDEALELDDNTKYGLAAYVWTFKREARPQLRTCHRVRHGVAELKQRP